MALTESTEFKVGFTAPNFHLKDAVSGRYFSLNDLKSDLVTVVMFICNHCPYVIHLNHEIVQLANEFRSKGVSFIAISANDAENYPEDAPDKMSIVAKVLKFPFPYLYDKTQKVAKAYDAACTPDFYVFNGDLELSYRGRFDNSKPGNNNPVTGSDLRNAIEMTILGQEISQQYPSIGCNIKWK